MTVTATSIFAGRRGRSRVRDIGASLLAAFLGLALVYFAGFANADILHNAAHDSRHSLSFPCH